jgi:hypothetical protein
MDRKKFIKLNLLSGASLTVFGLIRSRSKLNEYSFHLISSDPEKDRSRLMRLTGLSSNISSQLINPARQDLTVIKGDKIIDPFKSKDLDESITAFAYELRGRTQPGRYLLTAENQEQIKNTVLFQINNRVSEEIQLFRDYESIIIPGYIGNTEFSLTAGKLKVIRSSCNHNICKKTGEISNGKIVCVPNRLVAVINTRQNSPVDAITS